MDHRQTSFSDVCGTVDEFRRLLRGGRTRGPRDLQAAMACLLDDAAFMLGRMAQRRAEYQAFRDGLREVLDRLERIEAVDTSPAEEATAILQARAQSGAPCENADPEGMGKLAERIRDAANAQEHTLRTFKGLVLEVYDLFVQAKGSRPWLLTEDGKPSLTGGFAREHQAWLPPEPHRGILLDWLSRARAHVPEERGHGGEPSVQFEDGGCMAMSQVRWDPEVENFRPDSSLRG